MHVMHAYFLRMTSVVELYIRIGMEILGIEKMKNGDETK